MSQDPLRAVVWDYDSTLVDTRHRNMSVNRSIVEEITERPWQSFAALASLGTYEAAQKSSANWQEFYRKSFAFTDEQIHLAGSRWSSHQVADSTPTPLFAGIRRAIAETAHLQQAIVSQNARDVIETVIADAGVLHYFETVIGYAEVPLQRQKPAPDGLLRCLDELNVPQPSSVLYVGDHETDALCVVNTNRELEKTGRAIRVLYVAALYCDGASLDGWQARPDFVVHNPMEIVGLVGRLEGRQ